MKKILSLTLAFALILGITAIPALAEPAVIKIGVVGENNEQWEYIASVLKEEGIIIELVGGTFFLVHLVRKGRL